jgi:hypothetical protein
MKNTAVLLILLAAGCSRYTQAQIDLVTQARHGVSLCQESQNQHRQWVDRAHQLMRDRLDAAFDADVRQRDGDVPPDWIIEHRRAYSAALDALDEQRLASARADEVEKSNLQSIDRALVKLDELQKSQSKLAKKVEGAK